MANRPSHATRAKDPELEGSNVSYVCTIRREPFYLSFERFCFLYYPAKKIPRVAFSRCAFTRKLIFRRNLRLCSLEILMIMVNIEKKSSKIW